MESPAQAALLIAARKKQQLIEIKIVRVFYCVGSLECISVPCESTLKSCIPVSTQARKVGLSRVNADILVTMQMTAKQKLNQMTRVIMPSHHPQLFTFKDYV